MYRRFYIPEHHCADKAGMVCEHILVAEKALGRCLTEDEIVHHKNFCAWDNSGGNLLPLTRQRHQQLPKFQALFIIEKGLYKEFLKFWKDNEEAVNTETELQERLVKAQNDKDRLERRQDANGRNGELSTQKR